KLYTLTALSTFTIPLAPPMFPTPSNTVFFDFFDFGNGSVPSVGSSVAANMTYTVHEVNVIPVPASIPLLLTGIGGIYILRRRRENEG
ncbi:MAG: VPLPA-CTERM sorting domain-containing protein, partial [Pseudomonadota bacterium]